MIEIGLDLPPGTFKEAAQYGFVFIKKYHYLCMSDVDLTGHTY